MLKTNFSFISSPSGAIGDIKAGFMLEISCAATALLAGVD